jgi:hypothetical protein
MAMTSQDNPSQVARDLTMKEILGRMKLSEFAKFGAVCLAAIGGAYTLGASQPSTSHLSTTAVLADSTSQSEIAQSKVYHGYYADLNPDGTPTISDETLSMESLPNSEVKAKAKGNVKTKDGLIPRVWDFHGFQKGDRLSVSFSTVQTKEDPIAPGIGVYVLEQEGSSDYTGTAIFLDCVKRAMIQCPYALTTQNIDKNDAKGRWPKLFERSCAVLDLVPDLSAKNGAIPGSCQVANSK